MSDVVFAEVGANWRAVLFGPLFALAGALFEWATGPVHLVAWVLGGLVLLGFSALWVYGRRGACSVTLTRTELRIGRETQAVQGIRAVDDVGAPVGTRVLGGMWTVPKRCTEVPLRLADETVVLAWARDPDGLRDALRPLLPAVPH